VKLRDLPSTRRLSRAESSGYVEVLSKAAPALAFCLRDIQHASGQCHDPVYDAQYYQRL